MIPWVILLQMHLLTALYDLFGACYDKVPSVAVRTFGVVRGSTLGVVPMLSVAVDIFSDRHLYRDTINDLLLRRHVLQPRSGDMTHGLHLRM